MLACDLKRMTCDLNNLATSYLDGTDLVTVATTSDVKGFEVTRESIPPSRYIPGISADLAKRLIGFTITLPEPSTLTLSAKPAPKAASGGK